MLGVSNVQPLVFPAKQSAHLAGLGAHDGSSDDSLYGYSDSQSLGSSSASDDESLGQPHPSSVATSGSRRKKRCSFSAIHNKMECDEKPPVSQTVDGLLREKAEAMAKTYGRSEDEMRQLLEETGSDDKWYVCLLTTNTKRKTTTHISRTRSPFRKAALHSLGVVPTKTTRGAEWRLRLIIGPFGTKACAENTKNRWKRLCRTSMSRMTKGVSQARSLGLEYYFPFPEDEEGVWHSGE